MKRRALSRAVLDVRTVVASVRAGEWFSSKVPMALAVGYAQALVCRSPSSSSGPRLLAILISTSALGAFGYLANDFFDSDADRRAGRPTRIRTVRREAVAGALLFLAVVSVLPVFLAGAGSMGVALVIANLALAGAYSAPPVRLKERSLLGVLADSLAVHTFPAATASWVLGEGSLGVPAALAIAWSFLTGTRGILLHQLWDREADKAGGVRTFVAGQRPDRVRRVIHRVVFPAEALVLAAWFASQGSPGVAPFAALAVSAGVDAVRWRVWGVRPDPAPASHGAYVLPAGFYQAWLSLVLLGSLAWRDTSYLLVAAGHLVLFYSEIRVRAAECARLFVDALSLGTRAGRFGLRKDSRPARTSDLTRETWRKNVRPRVVVAASYWTLNGVNIFSANLVRGLRSIGFDAELLLTEERTHLVSVEDPRLPLPDDLPVSYLPVSPQASWGAHWGAMIRYLEERSPCVYVPNADWRHSCISPLLSGSVAVAGVVHSDDPLHYDHVARLGRSWNAIVAVSRAVEDQTAAIDPSFRPRLLTIPIGVEVPESLPQHATDPGGALRIVYHGLLNQRQKRILDLVGILDRLESLGVPFVLTLAGGGSQEPELRDLLDHHAERGRVRFAGVLPNRGVLRMLEEHDAFLMTSEFEGMPNALLEAMGRGCVPVVSRTRSALQELVRDGESGFTAPIGDLDHFARRLQELASDPALRSRMARRSFEIVAGGPHSVQEMSRRWGELCERVAEDAREGRFVRAAGAISPPPPEIDGLGIFPIPCSHVVPGLGAFPSRRDRIDFDEMRRSPTPREVQQAAVTAARRAEIRDFRVVVALPYWTLTGVTVFAANLVRGLRAQGTEAEILLTEERTDLISIPDPPMPLPPDLPVRYLPVGRTDGWGKRWAAMQRLLEESAPCVYLPNYDWRQSCVAPRLPRRVSVVGILHGDDPLHYDHLARQGRYWDAVVAVSQEIAEKAVGIDPGCAARLHTIPYGICLPGEAPKPAREAGGQLRLVYHGVLNVRQKRILDLPEIVRAVLNRGVDAVLTVIGAGPDEDAFRSAARELADRGAIRMLGVLSNEDALRVLESQDVYLMTSSFEGLPNALLEAMGRGCIPVVSAIRSGIPELVRDGEEGFIVPVGDIDQFADRIVRLAGDADLRSRMSQRAQERLLSGSFRIENMVDAYVKLFQQVLDDSRRGVFRRRQGPLAPPPATVAGVSLFPVECVEVRGLGRFPRHPSFEAATYLGERLLARVGRAAPSSERAIRHALETPILKRCVHRLAGLRSAWLRSGR